MWMTTGIPVFPPFFVLACGRSIGLLPKRSAGLIDVSQLDHHGPAKN